MDDDRVRECVIVGGGAAGLSAALVLGRARRDVLVVDAGRQSNLPADGVGGVLGHDGTPPEALYRLGRRQLEPYRTVRVVDGEVDTVRSAGEQGFEVILGGGHGEPLRAQTVLLATGMDYDVPALEGAAGLWGRSVFHCPFCHGWEVRDRGLAVLGGTEVGAMQAVLLTGWSADVVLLADGPPAFGPEQRAALASAGVPVVERPVARLAARDGALSAVVFADGSELPRDALLVHAPLRQRSGLATQLGLELTEAGTVAVDPVGAASVPGVFAAGDVAAPFPQLSLAVSAGATAAAAIVRRLVVEPHGMPPPGGPAGAGSGEPGGAARPLAATPV